MKKNFIKWSFALVLGALLVSCEPKPAPEPPAVKDGTLSEFEMARTTMTRYQPNSFSAKYVPSKGLTEKDYTFSMSLKVNGEEKDFPGAYPKVQNDDLGLRFMIKDCWVGECELTFIITEFIGESDYNTLSQTMKFTVTDQVPDIRNSFWGEKKEICRLDPVYYDAQDMWASTDPNNLTFKEKDYYVKKWSDNSTVNAFDSFTRKVFYNFDADSKLKDVEYDIFPVDATQEVDMIAALWEHADELKNPYYGAGEYEIFVKVTTNEHVPALTPEEDAAVKAFKAGTYKKDDASLTLTKAIQRGAVLIALSSSTKNNINVVLDQNTVEGAVVPNFTILFSPRERK